MTRVLLLMVVLSASFQALAQPDTLPEKSRKTRQALVITGITAISAGSFIYLNESWYKPYRSDRFHFFNDNAEWLQVDKAGHAFMGYQGTRILTDLFLWSGTRKNYSLYLAGAVTMGYQSAIEVLDGFSNGWGFSWGDAAANLAGVSLALAQQQAWGYQRIHLKFTYRATPLAQHNPRLLGDSGPTRLIKDYNGQVYWLSFNPFVVAGRDDSIFLPWLNLSVGYGAYGMTGAFQNPVLNASEHPLPVYQRERLLYLSLDIDLSRVHTRWKALNNVLRALNAVKIPAPALRLSSSATQLMIR